MLQSQISALNYEKVHVFILENAQIFYFKKNLRKINLKNVMLLGGNVFLHGLLLLLFYLFLLAHQNFGHRGQQILFLVACFIPFFFCQNMWRRDQELTWWVFLCPHIINGILILCLSCSDWERMLIEKLSGWSFKLRPDVLIIWMNFRLAKF